MKLILTFAIGFILAISFLLDDRTIQNDSLKTKKAWEHSIVLNIQNSTEKTLARSLTLSNYTCRDISLDGFIECSIKDYKWQSRVNPKMSSRPLMTSSSIYGDTLKIYENKDGSTHMEIFDNSSQTHHYYSFTSTKNLIIYSRMYQNEIFPENLNELPLRLN
jgi:hypothetical protein